MEYFLFLLIFLKIYRWEILSVLAVFFLLRYLFSFIYLFVRRIYKISKENFDKKSN